MRTPCIAATPLCRGAYSRPVRTIARRRTTLACSEVCKLKEDERLDSHATKEMSGLMSMLGRGAEVENAPERNTGRTDSTVQREANDIMSMLGR